MSTRALLRRLGATLAAWRSRVAAHGGPESGQAVNEWLGLSALGIVAIVAIGAALRALGVDIVDWIRGQLGI